MYSRRYLIVILSVIVLLVILSILSQFALFRAIMKTQYSSPFHSSRYEAQVGFLSEKIPIRLHNQHRLEGLAIIKARSDWCGSTAVDNVVDNGCIHPVYGGVSSLTIPQCLPNRLPIVSYANELFTLLDGCLKDCGEPQKVQAIVSDLMNILQVDHQPVGGGGQEGLGLSENNRKSLRKMVNSMTEIDPKRAEMVFELWLRHFEQQNIRTAKALDDYLAWRIQRFEWWRPLLLFGCGINTSPSEEPDLMRLSGNAFFAITLTTDLFTWDNMVLEANYSRTNPGEVPNAVRFIMQDRAIGADAAKLACRDMARSCTQQFLGTVERARSPGLYSAELVRYLENLVLMVGGNAVWCQSCPRKLAAMTTNMMLDQPKVKSMTIHDEGGKSDGNITFPWQYTAQSAEKDVICNLINALKSWYKVPDLAANTIRRCIELIHVSSTMLDDIEDGLPLRRGRPAAHIVFGVPQTVKSSKAMTIKGIKELAKLGNARCMRILLEEIVKKASVGQKMDTHWTSTCICPAAEDNVSSLDKKFGAPMRLIDKLMSAASPLAHPSKPLTHQFIILFARLHALRDNCPSHTLPDTTKVNFRSFYMSLDEGKYSLLLIHALQSLSEDQSLLLRGIMMQRRIVGRFMPEHKKFVLEMLKESKSFEYAADLKKQAQSQAIKALEEVEEQTGTDSGLRGLAEGV